MVNPLAGFRIEPSEVSFVGHDLARPECVLAERDGTLWAADARGGVTRIASDGSQQLVLMRPAGGAVEAATAGPPGDVAASILGGSLPNGLAFLPGGDLVVADFGDGSLRRMRRDGVATLLAAEIGGERLGSTNFVLVDSRRRIWLTVTTRLEPWTRSINERVADGYIACVEGGEIRLAADGFAGTNEIRLDAAEEWMYVVESNGRRISRLRLLDDGSLVDRQLYGPPDLGGIPDGFAFDEAGNLWITLVSADRLVALTPNGEVLTLLDAGDATKALELDRHFSAGTVTPELLGIARGTVAPLMASVTFGGPDLRTVYLGSLMGTRLPAFRSPVPGLPPAHWSW